MIEIYQEWSGSPSVLPPPHYLCDFGASISSAYTEDREPSLVGFREGKELMPPVYLEWHQSR